MSAGVVAAALMVGCAGLAAHYADPLGAALSRVLHDEVDRLEPTITCTPEAHASHPDKETSC